MPKKKYDVALSPEQEVFLKTIIHTGNKYSAREILHAQVLLHSNDNKPALKKDNREIAEWFGISPTTVNQIRKTYSENGLHAALQRKTRILCIFQQNRTSVPEGRDAVPLQTVR